MKKIVVYGASVLAEIAAKSPKFGGGGSGVVGGYAVSDEYLLLGQENEKYIVPASRMTELFPPSEYDAVVGLMVNDMYVIREAVSRKLKEAGYALPNLIHPSAVVETEDIGDGNLILPGVVIDSHCTIGSGNIFWPKVVLPHDNSVGDFCNLAPSVSFSGNSRIKNHCFVGNNSSLKNGITVHDFGFVGANSYVSCDIPAYGVFLPPPSERGVLLTDKKSTDMGF